MMAYRWDSYAHEVMEFHMNPFHVEPTKKNKRNASIYVHTTESFIHE